MLLLVFLAEGLSGPLLYCYDELRAVLSMSFLWLGSMLDAYSTAPNFTDWV
jgi:hypothetical protein